MTDIINKINIRDILIIRGDLNTKVGTDNTGNETVMGKLGIGLQNNNVERLIELSLIHALKILYFNTRIITR